MTPREQASLVAAVRDGSVDDVRAVLERGVEVDALAPRSGLTPLQIAAEMGFLEKVRVLLEEGGAAVNHLSEDGNTALTYAVSTQQYSVCEYLLANNADPNLSAAEMISPLDMSMIESDAKLATLLLEHGADPNKLTLQSATPVVNAVLEGSLAHVKLFEEYGGNLEFKWKCNITPLHLAATGGHQTIVEYLVNSGVNVVARTCKGNSAYELAVQRGHSEIAAYLRKVERE